MALALRDPHVKAPRGGSFRWSDGPAGVVLVNEFFGQEPITATLSASIGEFALDATGELGAVASAMGPGVKPRRRGKTWQQAFWEAEAREAFEEIEEAAEFLPARVVERAEKLLEGVEAFAAPRASIVDGIVAEAQAERARRDAAALVALAREAERIMAAKAAEQDDEEALLLLFA